MAKAAVAAAATDAIAVPVPNGATVPGEANGTTATNESRAKCPNSLASKMRPQRAATTAHVPISRVPSAGQNVVQIACTTAASRPGGRRSRRKRNGHRRPGRHATSGPRL
jgi:hypothetical protein